MNELMIYAAGMLVAAGMGGLKGVFAFVKKQKPVVKSLLVFGIAGVFVFASSFVPGVELGVSDMPLAALVAMGSREILNALKAVGSSDA